MMVSNIERIICTYVEYAVIKKYWKVHTKGRIKEERKRKEFFQRDNGYN